MKRSDSPAVDEGMLAYQQQQQNSASFTGDFSMLQSKLGNGGGSSSSIASSLGESPGQGTGTAEHHLSHLAHQQQQQHSHQYGGGGMQMGSPGNYSPYSHHPSSHHPQNVNLNLNLNPMLGGDASGGGAGSGGGVGGMVSGDGGSAVAGPGMMGGGGDPSLRHFDGLRAENQNYC